jgi:hypothetical protein
VVKIVIPSETSVTVSVLANFSTTIVTIQIGLVLVIGHNLNTWLDKIGKYSSESQQRINIHATVI